MDTLSNPEDVYWLTNPESDCKLPKELVIFKRELHFAHNTFSIGEDMSYVSDNIIPLLEGKRAAFY